jgi:hypothetical protein
MVLRERSKEALLPFIHTIKPDPIFSRRGNGIASLVSKGTEDLFVRARDTGVLQALDDFLSRLARILNSAVVVGILIVRKYSEYVRLNVIH